MDEVLKFLQEAGTWYLATVDGEGKPHVRPFGSQMIYNGKLYFQTGLKKDVAKQLLANPNIEISGMNKKGEWIRLSAKAIHDPSIEAQQAMLDAMPSLKKMYAAGDGNTAVFYLEDAKAQICSFTAPAKTIEF